MDSAGPLLLRSLPFTSYGKLWHEDVLVTAIGGWQPPIRQCGKTHSRVSKPDDLAPLQTDHPKWPDDGATIMTCSYESYFVSCMLAVSITASAQYT